MYARDSLMGELEAFTNDKLSLFDPAVCYESLSFLYGAESGGDPSETILKNSSAIAAALSILEKLEELIRPGHPQTSLTIDVLDDLRVATRRLENIIGIIDEMADCEGRSR